MKSMPSKAVEGGKLGHVKQALDDRNQNINFWIPKCVVLTVRAVGFKGTKLFQRRLPGDDATRTWKANQHLVSCGGKRRHFKQRKLKEDVGGGNMAELEIGR